MQSLQKVFSYKDQQVRTVIKNSEPWFVGKDVAEILGFSNSRDAISTHVFPEDKGVDIIDTPGGRQQVTIINESGLYALVFGSRLASAKQFKHWVTSEVLPSVRKHSGYLTPGKIEEILLNPDTIIQLATALKEERQKRLELEPKAEMHDLFLSAENNQPMSAVAKSLDMGRNKLFAFLREKKVLRYNNEPYQKYMDRGYFAVVEKPIVKGGMVENITQTLVTAKGVDFIGKLLKQEEVVKRQEGCF